MPPMSSHIRYGDEATQRGARFEQSLDRHDAGYDVSCLIPFTNGEQKPIITPVV